MPLGIPPPARKSMMKSPFMIANQIIQNIAMLGMGVFWGVILKAVEGFAGQTNSGVSISWSTITGRSSVDAEEVEKLLGFVPKKQGQESLRLSVKHNGGK